MLQNIQRKRALCKLISATFLTNSLGLPTVMAADVQEENTGLVVGDHSKDRVVDTSISNTDATDENGKPTIKGNDEDRNYPSWYFHEDGTPLTEAELKERNYKESYTSQEVASIAELVNTYGLAKVQKFGYNVSFRRNPDGSTTIDVNDKDNHNPTKGVEPGTDAKGKMGPVPTPDHMKPQVYVPSSDPTPTNPDPKTTPTCDAGSELVDSVCMVKCVAGSTRDLKGDKLCHVTSCPADAIFNKDKTACTVCPTGTAPNAAQTECVKKPVECGTNEIYADNDKTACKVCPTGTAPNAAKTECVTVVCASNEVYTDANKNACKTCPDELMPNADQTACVIKPRPAPKPPVKVCTSNEIKKSDGSCEACPTSQQPNSDGTACVYTQTCPTGQNIKKDTNGKDVVDAKGNPVCETTKKDTCDTSAGKEIWKDKNGAENCVDTCDAAHVRDENTGACVEKKPDACAAGQIKKEDGTCETCPSGQQPNADGTACVATTGGGGGGGGNSIGKALGAAAGIAALASLFGHHKPVIDGDGERPGPNTYQAQVVRNDVISAKDLKVTFFTKEMPTGEETNNGSPVLIAGQAPYYAKVHLGKLQKPEYGTLEKATLSIANVATGAVKFTPDQPFLFLKESLPARSKPYDGIISLTYRDAQGLAHVGQYHVPIYTTEMLNTLSADKQKEITDGNVDISYMDAQAVSKLYMSIQGATIVSAKWNNGYCELHVSGGDLVGDGINDTITDEFKTNKDKYLTVADDNIAQGDCNNDSLNGKEATFSRVALDYSINSEGELRSQGETQIGNTYYSEAEHSFDARKERIEAMTQDGDVIWPTVTQSGGDAYNHGTKIGWYWKDKEHTQGEWVDYMGNPLNPEQVTIAENGIDPSGGVKLSDLKIQTTTTEDGKTTWQAVTSDGKAIDINNDSTNVVVGTELIKDAAKNTLPETVSVLDTWINVIKNNNPLNKDTKYDNNNVGVFAGTSVDVDKANKNQIGDNSYQPLMKEIANKVVSTATGGAGMVMSEKTTTQEQKAPTEEAGETKSSQDGEGMSKSTENNTSVATEKGASEQAPAANGSQNTNKQVTVTGMGKAPANASNDTQAKLMARRAAISNAQAQLPQGTGYTIVEESYENGEYTVTLKSN